MNQKTSKKLRQLVKHLMNQGAVQNVWEQYTPDVRAVTKQSEFSSRPSKFKDPVVSVRATTTHTNAPEDSVFGGTVRLDAACGKAIYKQMKKRQLSHKAVA